MNKQYATRRLLIGGEHDGEWVNAAGPFISLVLDSSKGFAASASEGEPDAIDVMAGGTVTYILTNIGVDGDEDFAVFGLEGMSEDDVFKTLLRGYAGSALRGSGEVNLMSTVTSDEVYDVLMSVARGSGIPTLIDPESHWDVSLGEIGFQVGSWKIWVFNDAGDFDYIARVEAPDGRTGEFEDWVGLDGCASYQPDDRLYVKWPGLYRRMTAIFETTR